MDYRDTPMDGLVNEVFDEFLKTSFVPAPKPVLFLGDFDLAEWNYLGSTELGFPLVGDAAIVSFFVAKEFPDVRDYHISYDKKVREFDPFRPWEFHPFMANQVIPWLYNQIDLYKPVRSTFSHYLVEYMKTKHEAVWDSKIGGWKSTKTSPANEAEPGNKYAQAVKAQQDKNAEAAKAEEARIEKLHEAIESKDGNVLKVKFPEFNINRAPPAKDD